MRISSSGWTRRSTIRPRAGSLRRSSTSAVSDVLMGMFEFMMKSNISEAACVTHGGVIMSMLAQRGMPRRAPELWMADSGCGYLLQCSPELWMRDGIVEVERYHPVWISGWRGGKMMGMVHIYTGDGKGKTTAAVAFAPGPRATVKKPRSYEFLKGAKTGEAKSLAALGVEFLLPVEREKFTWTMTETEKAECRARQADTLARAAAHMAEYDLVVLDEVLCAVNAGMLSLADVLRTVREKAPNTELVLTGRGAPEELIALADYVSVIEARKHPFADGARTAARRAWSIEKAFCAAMNKK